MPAKAKTTAMVTNDKITEQEFADQVAKEIARNYHPYRNPKKKFEVTVSVKEVALTKDEIGHGSDY
ncbi:MAG TPA: hypothetical protein VNL17_12795 [Verrucomicrobiae bacterium]|nr:hypothetical protein [Verrucomicrobiae bacterium]